MPLLTYSFLGWVGLGLERSSVSENTEYFPGICFPAQNNAVNRKHPNTTLDGNVRTICCSYLFSNGPYIFAWKRRPKNRSDPTKTV